MWLPAQPVGVISLSTYIDTDICRVPVQFRCLYCLCVRTRVCMGKKEPLMDNRLLYLLVERTWCTHSRMSPTRGALGPWMLKLALEPCCVTCFSECAQRRFSLFGVCLFRTESPSMMPILHEARPWDSSYQCASCAANF